MDGSYVVRYTNPAAENLLGTGARSLIGQRFPGLFNDSATLEGMPAEIFRLKLAGVLSLILAPIDVAYSASDHVLLSYRGVSDLRDSSGNNVQALISFHPIDRTESDAASMSAARQAPLGACRKSGE